MAQDEPKPDAAETQEPSPQEQAPEQPAEQAEPSPEPEEAPEGLSAEEWRKAQPVLTRMRQKDTERIGRLEEKLDQVLGSLQARTQTPEAEPEPAAPTEGESAVERFLRASPTVKRLERELAETKIAAGRAAIQAKVEAARSKLPGFDASARAFGQWLLTRPGLASDVDAGRCSIEEAWAIWPEKPIARKAAGPRQSPRPAPKVETSSAAPGVVRDIRDIAGKKGRVSIEDVWSTAVEVSKREAAAASE